MLEAVIPTIKFRELSSLQYGTIIYVYRVFRTATLVLVIILLIARSLAIIHFVRSLTAIRFLTVLLCRVSLAILSFLTSLRPDFDYTWRALLQELSHFLARERVFRINEMDESLVYRGTLICLLRVAAFLNLIRTRAQTTDHVYGCKAIDSPVCCLCERIRIRGYNRHCGVIRQESSVLAVLFVHITATVQILRGHQ